MRTIGAIQIMENSDIQNELHSKQAPILTLQALLFGNVGMVVKAFVSQTHRSGEVIIANTLGGGTSGGGALSPFRPATLTVLVAKPSAILKLF